MSVNDQLERILKSPPLVSSPSLCRFLRYIVEETLAGRASEIKEHALGLASSIAETISIPGWTRSCACRRATCAAGWPGTTKGPEPTTRSGSNCPRAPTCRCSMTSSGNAPERRRLKQFPKPRTRERRRRAPPGDRPSLALDALGLGDAGAAAAQPGRRARRRRPPALHGGVT